MGYGEVELRSLSLVTTLLLPVLGSGAGCLATAPPSRPALDHQLRCVQALQAGELQRAHTHCRLCLQFDPFSPECHNAMGLVDVLNGDDASARTRFKQALRLHDDFAEARNNLGALELRAGDLDAAARHFEAALKIAPGYLDARYNLAQCRLRQGERARAGGGDPAVAIERLGEAELEYLAALELQPGHLGSQRDLAALYSLRAELAPHPQQRAHFAGLASEHGRRCLALAPRDHACHGNLAQLLLGLGRCSEAEQHARACVQADPGNLICQQILAQAHACAQQQRAAGLEAR